MIRKKISLFIATLLMAELGLHYAAFGADFHVSTGGRDHWSGTLAKPNDAGTDGPVASLTAARNAARKAGKGPHRILFHAGTYTMTEPVTFDAQDSGLTIEAAAGESVTISGNKPITGWKRDGEFWSADVPEVKEGKWDFRMLIVDGRFAPRARLPKENDKFFEHLNKKYKLNKPGEPEPKPSEELRSHMTYRPEDLGSWLNIKNAEIMVWQGWNESLVPIKAMDEATQTLTFGIPCDYPPGTFGPYYAVWNIREGLSTPGQWYLDRSAGKVVYYPLPGQEIDRTEFLAPVPDSLVNLYGSDDSPLRNITIRDLKFTGANTPLAGPFFGAQKLNGAIMLGCVQNCLFERVEFFNVAGHALKGDKCDKITILNCELRDIGATGAFVRGNNGVFENNLVCRVGLIHPSGVGFWTIGTNWLIRHNEMHDLPFCAFVAERNYYRFEANLIYRVMQQLQDGGAIYTGDNTGVVICDNYVHDIVGAGARHAYYIDERGHDTLIENNVSVNVAWPWHNHIGKNNVVRNNIAISEGDMKITYPRSSGYKLEHNILIAGGAFLLQGAPDAIAEMPNNVFFSKIGVCERELVNDDYQRAGKSELEVKNGSVIEDPKLIRPSETVFEFADDSPCKRLQIRPIDVSKAGRIKKTPCQ